jgi:transcriptional regulator with GAF, ATPase, and Fis domain
MMSCKFQTPRRAKLENPQTETVKAQERTSIQPPVTEEAPLPSPEPHVCPVVSIPPTGIALEEIERQAVIEALKMSDWVQKDAAELLCISPRVMNYKIKTLGIHYQR